MSLVYGGDDVTGRRVKSPLALSSIGVWMIWPPQR